MKSESTPWPGCEVCILAGGLSERMGRDKARLRLGRRTLLGHVRATVAASGLPQRVIRCDAVERCGPLGGVYTALTTTKHEAVIFLSCDMPFVSSATLISFARAIKQKPRAIFQMGATGVVGFPFALGAKALPAVAGQIGHKEFSLQKLARQLRAETRVIPAARAWEWFNVNTPSEWREARELWRNHGGAA